MASDPAAPGKPHPGGRGPLSASARHRLQKVYEHGQRCVDKQDYDYAHQLFSQCVSEDPASILYLQAMLGNLERKHAQQKSGRLANLKIKSPRAALAKATGRGEWEAAFRAGCAALAINPWDVATLIGLAEACRELEIDECQLYYLRWALNAHPQHAEVNRLAAQQLTRMGQFDQAIACWRRVDQADPEDDEARQAISRLSVERAIQVGGYGQEEDTSPENSADEDSANASPAPPLEDRLQAALADDPTSIEAYAQLADFYLHGNRLDEAERVLAQANDAAGGGSLEIRERLEEVHLRRARRQVAAAEGQFAEDPSEEARATLANYRQQANQVELEVYAARSDRDVGNTRLKYELGVRLKRAGKPKEAIPVLQAARGDTSRLPTVLLELGECFQKIEQYKLALSHYEQAIDAAGESNDVVRKLALYRAGVLATGLRELDLAERRLTELAGLDYGYRDVADRLDKLAELRDSG